MVSVVLTVCRFSGFELVMFEHTCSEHFRIGSFAIDEVNILSILAVKLQSKAVN